MTWIRIRIKCTARDYTWGKLLGRSAIPIPTASPIGLEIENMKLEIIKFFTDITDCAMFKPRK